MYARRCLLYLSVDAKYPAQRPLLHAMAAETVVLEGHWSAELTDSVPTGWLQSEAAQKQVAHFVLRIEMVARHPAIEAAPTATHSADLARKVVTPEPVHT